MHVANIMRTCYEDAMMKLFPWNLSLTVDTYIDVMVWVSPWVGFVGL